MDKDSADNHSNQFNPNNENYQGYDSSYQGSGTQADLDNHANQCNTNNEAYHSSRKWRQILNRILFKFYPLYKTTKMPNKTNWLID